MLLLPPHSMPCNQFISRSRSFYLKLQLRSSMFLWLLAPCLVWVSVISHQGESSSHQTGLSVLTLLSLFSTKKAKRTFETIHHIMQFPILKSSVLPHVLWLRYEFTMVCTPSRQVSSCHCHLLWVTPSQPNCNSLERHRPMPPLRSDLFHVVSCHFPTCPDL